MQSINLIRVAFALAWAVPGVAVGAGTFYVDGSTGSCSNTGPGTEALPYCTISAAIAARNGPGTTLIVKPGVYREQVTVPSSGNSFSPFVIQGSGGVVEVVGSDDLSGPSNFTLYAGSVYLAAGVTWVPTQVFVDGVRLMASAEAPNDLPSNTFRHVLSEGLYINLGGDDPGTHAVEVSRRAYGFRLSSRSFVTIEGFDVLRTNDRGIYLTGTCNAGILRDNRVRFSGHSGISISGGVSILVESSTTTDNLDDGISLVGGATGCTVQDNESARNQHPIERKAQGIELSGAPGNLVQRNRLHHNQDTGEHFSSAADDNTSIQNLSWSNGDHGYDRLNSRNTLSIGDVAYGNANDGFSNEGTSSGGRMYDCIAIDNGLTSGRFDLLVDAQASVGFVSDYNIFWNSNAQAPIKYITTTYPTIAGYRVASGQDAHSLQADPRFVDPGGADFHLLAGSPAIDAATSGVAGWPPTDAEGRARVDDPGVTNTGAGPVPYADRGALEFVPTPPPPGSPPVVIVLPAVGGAVGALLAVAVTAYDPDGDPIESLTATGLPAGAMFLADPGDTSGVFTWTPGTGQAGVYVVTFTAANALPGVTNTTLTVVSLPTGNLVLNPSFEVNTNGWGGFSGSALSRIAGGADGAYSLEIRGPTSTASFGANDTPNWVGTTAGIGTRYRFSARVRSVAHGGEVKLRVREYLAGALQGGYYSSGVFLSPVWQGINVDYVTVANGTTIDFQITDFPLVGSEVFQVDDVSIRVLTGAGSSRAPMELLGRLQAGTAWEREPLRPCLDPDVVRTGATLSFATSRDGALRVDVFDLAGRRVRRLLDRIEAPAGVHRVRFDATDDEGSRLRAGVYFYRIEAHEGSVTGRFLLLR